MLNKISSHQRRISYGIFPQKKRGVGRVVLILILCLALIAVIAVMVGYSLVARRVKALQAGAAFTFDYEAVSTADSPALYTILQKPAPQRAQSAACMRRTLCS